MQGLELIETKHPDTAAARRFAQLVGLDSQKEDLLSGLRLILTPEVAATWQRHHHPSGLGLIDRCLSGAPLAILSGDVGCGKTALAGCIGTPLAEILDTRLLSLETPSNIRGSGHVGELSLRISAAFEQARGRLRDFKYGLLIIDEGDDLAASRAQVQAHHEDRAGLNVLVKQLDQLSAASVRLAVILITNRLSALDPAIRRRASVSLAFHRPGVNDRAALFGALLDGVKSSGGVGERLAAASERTPPFAYSDIVHRIGRRALLAAMGENRPLCEEDFLQAIDAVAPSPVVEGEE